MKGLLSSLLMIAALTLVCSCKKDTFTEPPRLQITSIQPERASIGQRVTIGGTEFNHPLSVYFNGVLAVLDSGTSTKLYCPVPWGASGSVVSVKTLTDSVPWGGFTILQDCQSQLCVIWNRLDSIREQDASVTTHYGAPVPWSASVHGDTVELFRTYYPSDEASVNQILKFRHMNNNVLPEFISGYYTVNSTWPPPVRIDTLSRGIIRIQGWNDSGIVSGRFFGEYDINFWDYEITFWYDFR